MLFFFRLFGYFFCQQTATNVYNRKNSKINVFFKWIKKMKRWLKISISIAAMLVSRNAFNFQMAENQQCPVKMKRNVIRILLQIISCKFMIMINHHINRARQNAFQAFYDYSWCAIENIADSLSLPHSCCSCYFCSLHLIHMRAHILILETVGHIISGSLSTQFSLNSTENASLSTQLILMMQWNGFYFGFLFYFIFVERMKEHKKSTAY